MLRLSSATAAAAAAAALTATTGAAAAPRNETLPVGAAPRLGPAAENDADPVAAALSANAMAGGLADVGVVALTGWAGRLSPHVSDRSVFDAVPRMKGEGA
jgi:hypothetical protein